MTFDVRRGSKTPQHRVYHLPRVHDRRVSPQHQLLSMIGPRTRQPALRLSRSDHQTANQNLQRIRRLLNPNRPPLPPDRNLPVRPPNPLLVEVVVVDSSRVVPPQQLVWPSSTLVISPLTNSSTRVPIRKHRRWYGMKSLSLKHV